MFSQYFSSQPKGGANTDASTESLWVGVRLRPLSDQERLKGEQCCWEASGPQTLLWRNPSGEKASGAGTSYAFDRVFPTRATSQEVYEHAVEDRVLTALKGINATVCVYGPTGSGKTYTMRAILQQACTKLFAAVEDSENDFLLRITAMEIYNERVRDLLKDNTSHQNLGLLDDPERGTIVDGLSEEGVQSAEHLQDLLTAVEQQRVVRDTRLNLASSRSHQVVRLYIETRPPAHNDDTGGPGCAASSGADGDDAEAARPVTSATLCFVDLAGSERSSSGGKDDAADMRLRQAEGGAINKSLLTLGNVIRALAEGKARSHVPFRDSKLTRVLQTSLGGNSRTAIITCIGPAGGSAETSRMALSFSMAAKRIMLTPTVNLTMGSKAEIRLLQEEIGKLQRQLAAREAPGEAAQLSAALEEKQKEVEMTAEQRDLAQKRLRNLERLILRAGDRSIDRRKSWSIPGAKEPSCASSGKSTGERPTTRVSWHPAGCRSMGPSPATPRQGQTRRLLLDSYLGSAGRTYSPGLSSATNKDTPGSVTSKDVSGTAFHLSALDDLPESGDVREEAALAALQAEVRCIKHAPSSNEKPAAAIALLKDELRRLEAQTSGNLEEREETAHALHLELQRLQEVESTQRTVDTALASLQKAVGLLPAEGALGASNSGPLPQWVPYPSDRSPPQPANLAMAELFDPSCSSLPPEPSCLHDEDTASSLPCHSPWRRGRGDVRDSSASFGICTIQEGVDVDDEVMVGSPQRSPERPMGRSKENMAGSVQYTQQPWEPGVESPRSPLAERGHGPPPAASPACAPSATVGVSGRGAQDKLRMAPEAALMWYKAELRRMQTSFRETVERDVTQLKEALQKYEDQAHRLECQKTLLLKQVLRLEYRVEELTGQLDESNSRLEEAENEICRLTAAAEDSQVLLAQAQREAAEASERAAAAEAAQRRNKEQSSPSTPIAAHAGSRPFVPLLKLRGDVPMGMLDADDSWAAPPSAESLLPKIVDLWEALYVPLVHRSRFVLAFQGRETFYYEAEHRRLCYLRSKMTAADDGSPPPRSPGPTLAKAQRRLDWERKWLANQLKWDFSGDEREDLFLAWNVHRESKERKLQLVRRLWSPEVVREPDGVRRSSELVLRLNDTEPTDGMFDMVFGRNEGTEPGLGRTAASMIGPLGGLLKAVASPVRQSMLRESSSGLPQRRRSFMSAVSGLAGQLTPRGRAAAAAQSPTPVTASVWTPARGSAAWNAIHETPPRSSVGEFGEDDA